MNLKTKLSLEEKIRRYRMLCAGSSSLREQPARGPSPPPQNELALQARFFGGEFGDCWTTMCGHEVRLLDPGEWNREAGPDFRGATIQLDGGERMRGDIEIDLQASGWEEHGHATNPAFENVILHLFFRAGARRCFARTPGNRAVLQVQLCPPAGPPVSFSLDSEPLNDPAQAIEIIGIAAAHRLAAKAARFRVLEHLHGKRNALLQAVAAALGYRHNQIPMTLLAQRSGAARASGPDGEALLFGLAGFLRADAFDSAPGPNRAYLRGMWESWWLLREQEARMILPASAWKFSGIRPANHPHRRVAALGLAAAVTDRLLRAVDAGNSDLFGRIFTGLAHPFWDVHWNLAGESLPHGRSVALVGDNRVAELLTNIFCPLQLARGGDPSALLESLRCEPAPSAVVRTADWLCPGIPRERLTFAAMQQGLYQLAADFRGYESPRDLARRMLERS